MMGHAVKPAGRPYTKEMWSKGQGGAVVLRHLRRQKGVRGFSMVQLMIALGLLGVVAASTSLVVSRFARSLRFEAMKEELTIASTFSINQLSQDLNEAVRLDGEVGLNATTAAAQGIRISDDGNRLSLITQKYPELNAVVVSSATVVGQPTQLRILIDPGSNLSYWLAVLANPAHQYFVISSGLRSNLLQRLSYVQVGGQFQVVFQMGAATPITHPEIKSGSIIKTTEMVHYTFDPVTKNLSRLAQLSLADPTTDTGSVIARVEDIAFSFRFASVREGTTTELIGSNLFWARPSEIVEGSIDCGASTDASCPTWSDLRLVRVNLEMQSPQELGNLASQSMTGNWSNVGGYLELASLSELNPSQYNLDMNDTGQVAAGSLVECDVSLAASRCRKRCEDKYVDANRQLDTWIGYRYQDPGDAIGSGFTDYCFAAADRDGAGNIIPDNTVNSPAITAGMPGEYVFLDILNPAIRSQELQAWSPTATSGTAAINRLRMEALSRITNFMTDSWFRNRFMPARFVSECIFNNERPVEERLYHTDFEDETNHFGIRKSSGTWSLTISAADDLRSQIASDWAWINAGDGDACSTAGWDHGPSHRRCNQPGQGPNTGTSAGCDRMYQDLMQGSFVTARNDVANNPFARKCSCQLRSIPPSVGGDGCTFNTNAVQQINSTYVQWARICNLGDRSTTPYSCPNTWDGSGYIFFNATSSPDGLTLNEAIVCEALQRSIIGDGCEVSLSGGGTASCDSIPATEVGAQSATIINPAAGPGQRRVTTLPLQPGTNNVFANEMTVLDFRDQGAPEITDPGDPATSATLAALLAGIGTHGNYALPAGTGVLPVASDCGGTTPCTTAGRRTSLTVDLSWGPASSTASKTEQQVMAAIAAVHTRQGLARCFDNWRVSENLPNQSPTFTARAAVWTDWRGFCGNQCWAQGGTARANAINQEIRLIRQFITNTPLDINSSANLPVRCGGPGSGGGGGGGDTFVMP
jgi:type II secretory pathway pseudopilin PulG